MNKIGWCSETWNPVIGCKRNCNYCYARAMNKRFGFIKNWDIPEWREKGFNKKFPRGPQKIFIGSMSEIYYWKADWIQKVIDKTKEYPQHIFQFLTKYPQIYLEYDFPKNCWLGVTNTREIDVLYSNDYRRKNIYFYSLEPLLDRINPESLKDIDWVIIGAETGEYRKGKIIPKRDWIKNIVDYCRDNEIPIYLKNSLKSIYPEVIKEFPGTKTELKLF